MRTYIYALTALASLLAAQPVFAEDQCNGTVISGDIKWPNDNLNGTVTDSNTGLTWSKCLYGQSGNTCAGTIQAITWSAALGKTTSKWRLPNIKELQSIVKEENATSSLIRPINKVCFPTADAQQGQSNSFPVWSSSPLADYATTTEVWLVDFGGGFFARYPTTAQWTAYVRYVCDGDATACTSPPVP